jgi:MoxR-like ATPase
VAGPARGEDVAVLDSTVSEVRRPVPPAGGWHPASVAQALVGNIRSVLRGHDDVVEMVVVAVLAGGHVLIEDVPGSGKTTLARAVARSLGGSFARIQATSDLLPADVTGAAVWHPERFAFEVVPGPIFANVVLVDELNRASPRTQSGLLEAMDEAAVTVDGRRCPLPEPFTLVATQNPHDQHGTYHLPEGQLDRFAVCLHLGPLAPAYERVVVQEQLAGPTVDALTPVVDVAQLLAARDRVRSTHVADEVLDYALAVVQATRVDPRVAIGASTRAGLMLVRLAQSLAVLRGRDYVLPDDVKHAAHPCLAHRLSLVGGAGGSAAGVVRDVVSRVPVPVRR